MESEVEDLIIKNMVCPRCISAVREGLEELNYEVLEVNLGIAKIKTPVDKGIISIMLNQKGFELLDHKDKKIVEQIKISIINLVQSTDVHLHQNLSVWLKEKLDIEYHHLSTLFSEAEGITIERFFILQRIEKVKELLVYDELNLKEIAFKVGFSSVAHLSAQFKKITGFTTSHFKSIGFNRRKSLDRINS